MLISFAGCKDSTEDTSSSAYNPNLPVTISSFIPESGGANTQLVVFGENFGNDPTKVNVKVGGIDALIINVKNNCLYCFVPEKSGGKIEITVENSKPAISEKEFTYEFKKVVSTLCGHVDELGQGRVLTEGSFDELEKIESMSWMSFDPKDKNILYCAQDKGANVTNSLFKFDLKERYMNTLYSTSGSVKRLMAIDWYNDDEMIISTPQGNGETYPGSILLKRDQNFKEPNTLISRQSIQSCIYNETAGYLYYTSSKNNLLYSYDITTHGINNNTGNDTQMYAFPGQSARLMVEHPSGSYMYIVEEGNHSIYRADFDPVTKNYSVPYIICGGGNSNAGGYEDKIGINARLQNPWQGVFVKNKERTSGDVYDFYFCDRGNHCIRILTPDGVVSTFAGRGSRSLNSAYEGYVDGDLRDDARFNYPQAIAYDEENDAFYVFDKNNYRIRKIAMEESVDAVTDETEGVTEDENNGGNESPENSNQEGENTDNQENNL